jgi:hypothetical protein
MIAGRSGNALHHRHGTRQISSGSGQVGGGARRMDEDPGSAFNACEDAAI